MTVSYKRFYQSITQSLYRKSSLQKLWLLFGLLCLFLLFISHRNLLNHNKEELISITDNKIVKLPTSEKKGLFHRTPIGPARHFTQPRSKVIQHTEANKNKPPVNINYGNGNNTRLLKSEDIRYFDCSDYFKDVSLTRSVLYNVLNAEHKEHNEICLITQFDEERVDSFIKQLHVWQGPVSASIYIEEGRVHELMNQFQDVQVLLSRINVKMHLVLKKGEYYPVNALRNIAISEATAKYIFTTDVDFVLSKDLYKAILNHIKRKGNDFENMKTAMIVPAFDLMDKTYSIPTTKKELQKSWNKTEAVQFHHYFKRGHAATDYERWFKERSLYKIDVVPKGYEPYIVLPRKQSPLYDERFLEYYMNKIQYMDELMAKQFSFEVIPDGFVIHIPHRNRQTNYETVAIKRCVKPVYDDFTEELKVKYGLVI